MNSLLRYLPSFSEHPSKQILRRFRAYTLLIIRIILFSRLLVLLVFVQILKGGRKYFNSNWNNLLMFWKSRWLRWDSNPQVTTTVLKLITYESFFPEDESWRQRTNRETRTQSQKEKRRQNKKWEISQYISPNLNSNGNNLLMFWKNHRLKWDWKLIKNLIWKSFKWSLTRKLINTLSDQTIRRRFWLIFGIVHNSILR